MKATTILTNVSNKEEETKSQSNKNPPRRKEHKNTNKREIERERGFIFASHSFPFCFATDNTTINTDLKHLQPLLFPSFLFYPSLSHTVLYKEREREKGCHVTITASPPNPKAKFPIFLHNINTHRHSHPIAFRFCSLWLNIVSFFALNLLCEDLISQRDGEFIWVLGVRREVGVGGEGRRFG